MTQPVFQLRDASFARAVFRSAIPVLVRFRAAWCSPCRSTDATIATLAREWAGRVTVASVDTDASPVTAAMYCVDHIPVYVLFQNGAPVKPIPGHLPLAALRAQVEAVVGTETRIA